MVCERVPALKNCITDEAYEHFKEQLIEKTFINMISLSNAPVDLHLDTTDGERGQAGGWTVGRVRGRWRLGGQQECGWEDGRVGGRATGWLGSRP
jgi:hypothetical protein